MIGRIADVIVGLNKDPEATPHAFLFGLVLFVLPAFVVLVVMWSSQGPLAVLGAMGVGGFLFAFGGLFVRWVDYCNPDDEDGAP